MYLPRALQGERDDEDDRDIFVYENTPSTPPRKTSSLRKHTRPTNRRRLFYDMSNLVEDEDKEIAVPSSYQEATLQLDLESIVVLNIEAVEYIHHDRAVARIRLTDGQATGIAPL